MKPEHVRLSVDGSQLILSGEKVRPEPSAATRFHCVERGYGKFQRVIQIGAAVNPHQARVAFRDGLLQVMFPKVENRRGGEVVIPVDGHGGME